MRAIAFGTLVTLRRLASNSSDNLVWIQNALSVSSDAGATCLEAFAPRQVTNETAMTQTAICRRVFIAAEYDSAAMNAALRELPKKSFTAGRTGYFFPLKIASTLQGPPPANAM